MFTSRRFLMVLTLGVSAAACGLPALADLGEDAPAPTTREKPRSVATEAKAVSAEPKSVAPAPQPAPAPAVPAFINSDASMLLVVPSRYTIVQLAFDMAKIRPMAIVAYDDSPTSKVSRLHVWDATVQDWLRMEFSEFKSASFIRAPPKDLLVIGNDIAGLGDAASWASTKKRISTFSIVTVVNTLDEILSFSNSEWKTLARKYDLKLKDQNDERRRLGRWGRSGHEQPPAATAPETVLPPPPPPKLDEADKAMEPLPVSQKPISEVIIPEPAAPPAVPAPAPVPAPASAPTAPRSKAPMAPEDK